MHFIRGYGATIFAGVFLGIAWLFPLGLLAALCGWLSVVCWSWFLRNHEISKSEEKTDRFFIKAFIGGIIAQGIACYWLIYTISHFGRFPLIIALIIFLLFLAAHGLQFVIGAILFRFLPQITDRYLLRIPLAMVSAEIIYPSLFPWMFGHTQLGFTELAQSADLGGVPIISFAMWWAASAIIKLPKSTIRQYWTTRLPGLSFAIILILYGNYTLSLPLPTTGTQFPVALVQANISTEEKRDMTLVVTNEKRYQELSEKYASTPTLVVWPETVVQRWIPEIGEAPKNLLPRLSPSATLLTGALSYNKQEEHFNSAFVIAPNGKVWPPYHKQILMPFGEYVPFINYLPWLQNLTGPIGSFTPGTDVSTISISLSENSSSQVVVSPLICYEDIVPSISRKAVNLGANLLVNITNDAWFGLSAAPYQHHLIASFRAIENRRPLVRATNTGLTAYVNIYGKTESTLPMFGEGTLLIMAPEIKIKTVFSNIGHTPWYVLCVATLLLCALSTITIWHQIKNKMYN